VFHEATGETVGISATLDLVGRCDSHSFIHVAVVRSTATSESGRRYLFRGADFVEIAEPCNNVTAIAGAVFDLIPIGVGRHDACDASNCRVHPEVELALTFDDQGELIAAAATGEGGASLEAARALEVALRYLGTPYQWAGSTPETGFDAPGLVQYAYLQVGIQLPRLADQQFLSGTAVSASGLLPGDLVFFMDFTGYVYHVGMSLGGDKFVHAPHTGDVVKISSLNEPFYAGQFAGARRIT